MGTAKWIAGLLGWVAFGPIGALLGVIAGSEAMRILSGLSLQEVNVYSVGGQIAANMNYSQRLQLFHYLAASPRPGRAEGCRREIPKDPGGV